MSAEITPARTRLLALAEGAGFPALHGRRLEIGAGRAAWEQFLRENGYSGMGRAERALECSPLCRCRPCGKERE